MATITIEHVSRKWLVEKKSDQIKWQRIALLGVMGYEAAGCLLGGSLLVAAPDGRLMDMPVDIMHGVFKNFLIPGIILVGLGVLSTFAFISVWRKNHSDWVMAGLALGGLYIWFVVEIIILQELHWLHLMWGLPVLLGWVVTIPLIALRHNDVLMQKVLLTCGILASLWYVIVNIFVPMLDNQYTIASLTVSELSAIGAPTRITWVLLCTLYPLLFAAFGWGVWQSATANRSLRIMSRLIIVYSVMNFYWPPMHQRDVIAAGGGTLTDTLHIVWASVTLLFMLLVMGFGAAGLGRKFRFYTLVTGLVFMAFGVLTWLESPGIEANLPTPWIGIWERINIGAFMVWVMVLTIVLIRKEKKFIQLNLVP
jgi:hypothetical protein